MIEQLEPHWHVRFRPLRKGDEVTTGGWMIIAPTLADAARYAAERASDLGVEAVVIEIERTDA